MDWCPIVNASTSKLLQQISGAVAVSLPGHVLLSEEPEVLGAYDTIIDTHVAVFNLDYPPLFPEKKREPFEVVKHIQIIETYLRAGGVAFLLCQGAAIFNAVVFNVLSSSLEVVRVVRCLSPGQRQNSHSHSDSSAEEVSVYMRCQLSVTKLICLLYLLADSVGYHQEKDIKVRGPTYYTDNFMHMYK